jgi:hypothetical protein
MAGEFAIEFAEQRDAVGELELRAGRGKRGILRRRRTVDDERRARQRLDTAASDGSLIQSCAQASRARSASTAPRSTTVRARVSDRKGPRRKP